MAEDVERRLTMIDNTLATADQALAAAVAEVVDVESALARVKRAARRRAASELDGLDTAAAPPIIGL